MKIAKVQEMKDIDQKASLDFGIPSIILMENAGLRTVEAIEDILGSCPGKKVSVLSGKGNNGGDGMVVSRHLINAGAQVDTFLLGDENNLTPDALTNYQILKRMQAAVYPLQAESGLDRFMMSILSADLVVDAIYGIGLKGGVNEFESRVVNILNWSRRPVVAVDIPSGVEADTGKVYGAAVQATHTVTLALPKLGLLLKPGRDYVGTLSVADISIPLPLLNNPGLKHNLIDDKLIKSLLKKREPEGHKGTYGHAMIIGGSPGMSGAVMMSSWAALRCGAGLVTAAVPESLVPVVDSALLEVMAAPLAQNGDCVISPEALPAIDNLLGTVSVGAVGPGMSRYSEARTIISFILQNSGIPLVIDADGLNALEGDTDILKNRQVPLVLTPHPGEMGRLTGRTIEEIQSRRLETARDFAEEHGLTLVLKGHHTVVATPTGEVFINMTGNPGMATAGSGDVLTGIITALIAQGLNPQQAAVAGVYLHGAAGDQAALDKGERGLVATDLIHYLPQVIRRFEVEA
ncbi:MAG: NAD(P)H-hydrate dehydratase [Syntrophomonadaceae bacterium]